MTTGEKLAALRKRKGITQEQLSEILKISRQSVSRWEMDVTFPETDKLIKLSKLLECSIDFLLNDELEEDRLTGEFHRELSPGDCAQFIRECGYFFLATCTEGRPGLRPMGMLYGDDKALYFVTDSRKSVFECLIKNPMVALASYNLYTRKWIRINGCVEVESSLDIRKAMLDIYPVIRQEYVETDEIFFVIFKLTVENVTIN